MSEAAMQTMLSGDISAAMKRTNDIACQAVAERNPELLNQVYSAAARILPPGHPAVSGREAVVAFWRSVIEAGLTHLTLATKDVIPAGDYLTEIGEAQLTLGGEQAIVKYVVLWTQEDNTWKWHVDIWNPNA